MTTNIFLGYTPSPASAKATIDGINVAADIWFNAHDVQFQLHLVEQAADGTWGYLGGTQAIGLLWAILAQAAPIGTGTYDYVGPPGYGITSAIGDFNGIAAQVGAANMAYQWSGVMADRLTARFAANTGGASSADPRTAQEQATQHAIAVALANMAIVPGPPITVTHP